MACILSRESFLKRLATNGNDEIGKVHALMNRKFKSINIA